MPPFAGSKFFDKIVDALMDNTARGALSLILQCLLGNEVLVMNSDNLTQFRRGQLPDSDSRIAFQSMQQLGGAILQVKMGKLLGNQLLKSWQMNNGEGNCIGDGRKVVGSRNDRAASLMEEDTVSAIVGADHRDSGGKRVSEHGSRLFFTGGMQDQVGNC